MATISQAYILPILGGGSYSPPGAADDGAASPYSQSFLPSPSASSPKEAAERKKFDDFKKMYGKSYRSSGEETYRLGVFSANSKKIDDFNKGPDQGWKKGYNQFSDLDDG